MIAIAITWYHEDCEFVRTYIWRQLRRNLLDHETVLSVMQFSQKTWMLNKFCLLAHAWFSLPLSVWSCLNLCAILHAWARVNRPFKYFFCRCIKRIHSFFRMASYSQKKNGLGTSLLLPVLPHDASYSSSDFISVRYDAISFGSSSL